MNNTELIDNKVKVSVIMPIYNAFDYLRPAMDSVIDQTLRDIEIICIDDGSTDHSLDIIKEYQKNDERIRIITETNAGPALARNNGLKRARGEYVAFLDADDFFETTLLERLYTVAKKEDLDVAIARYDIYNSKLAEFRENVESDHGRIYENGKVTSKNEYPDYILQSTTGSAWNKLFRRSFLLEKNITFLTEVKMFEDVYFTIISLAFAERVSKLPEILIHHRIYNDQSRARHFKKYFSQVPEVYLKVKEFLMKGGMYEPLSRGFLNLSASRCLQIYRLLWSDAKEDFWNMLHDGFAEKLGWFERSEECFERAETCDFCANIQLYNHKQYSKRCSKGLKLKLGHIKQKLVQSNKWKRFRARLTRIFGKNSNKD